MERYSNKIMLATNRIHYVIHILYIWLILLLKKPMFHRIPTPLLILLCFVAAGCKTIKTDLNQNLVTPAYKSKDWKLVFSDEFNKKEIDSNKWSHAPRWHPAWAKFLTDDKKYAHVSEGNLVLLMDNQKIDGDELPYHSGGIHTSKKFDFTYGKVEVRAKFNQGKGSWPAIWMMPKEPHQYGNWPNSGEIDIMEHVNMEPHVHQTIHSGAETTAAGGSNATVHTAYRLNDYNTYGIIWEEDKIDFFVNGTLTFSYNKQQHAGSKQWPFDQPFYLILNQSGGAGWPGPITDVDLPFKMHVDYVRIYQKNK